MIQENENSHNTIEKNNKDLIEKIDIVLPDKVLDIKLVKIEMNDNPTSSQEQISLKDINDTQQNKLHKMNNINKLKNEQKTLLHNHNEDFIIDETILILKKE